MTEAPEQKLVSIESVFDYLPDRPVATTRGRGWPGATVDLHSCSPEYFASIPARDHHVICYCPTGRGRLIQRRAGAVHESVFTAGMLLITPAECESIWEGEAAPSARLRFPNELVQSAADEIAREGQPGFEIANVFRARDPQIENYCKLFLAEIENSPHPSQHLIVESLSYALAAHLLRNYNALNAPGRHQKPTLSDQTVANIASYIDEYIDDPISLADLAAIANISRFHFARVFKRSTGLTPMAFVERARILRAQDLLKRGELPLSEIAVAMGFADQSHFTRRFHRHVGCTPATYVRERGASGLRRR